MKRSLSVRIAILCVLLASFVSDDPLAHALRGPLLPRSSEGARYAIRDGRLIDPATGTTTANQTILIENGLVREIGHR